MPADRIKRLTYGILFSLLGMSFVVLPTVQTASAEAEKPNKKKAATQNAAKKEAAKKEAAKKATEQKKEEKRASSVPLTSTITTPANRPSTALPPAKLAQAIDGQILNAMRAESLTPSEVAGDAEFLRRVCLDITGVIPKEEVAAAFLASKDADKRAKLIDQLLESPRFGLHLADIWTPLLFADESDNRFLKKDPLTAWLAKGFNEDKPWHRMVFELMTATGDYENNPETLYFLANRTVDKMTDTAAKNFLGIQLQCAQCHNHPFTDWKQSEYWAMAAFFMKVEAEPARNPKKDDHVAGVKEVMSPNRKKAPLPEAAKQHAAKFLGGKEADLPPRGANRPVLAQWMVSPENPYFAKAAVNRVWSWYFGKGLVNPVDDMLPEHAPSHPELLNQLAGEFVASNFSIKHLVRSICNSDSYQRTSKPNTANKEDKTRYSHQAVRVLTPEQLFDSLTTVIGLDLSDVDLTKKKGAAPKGAPTALRDRFVAFFEVPETTKPTEYETGIPQVLRLMNNQKLTTSGVLLREVNRAGSTEADRLDKLYLTALSRHPSEEEVTKLKAYIAKQSDRATAYGDILWAILNSSEFALNR